MKQNHPIHYLGFDLLETFVRHARDAQPVYLILTSRDRKPTVLAQGFISWQITASQILGDVVHYWLCKPVALTYSTTPDDTGHYAQRLATADSAIKAVQEYFASMQRGTVPALLAFPEDVRLLEGGFHRLGYDPTTKLFHLKSDETQAT